MQDHRRFPVGAPFAACLALLVAAAVPAQTHAPQAPTVRPAPPRLSAAFDVGAATVQNLHLRSDSAGGYAVAIDFGGRLRTLALHLHDVRSPGFELLVQDGNGTREEPTPPCVTYRGRLLEEPDVEAAATIVDGSLTAILRRPAAAPGLPGVDWVVQPVRDVDPAAGPTLHAVYRATDTLPLPFQCGNGAAAPLPLPTGVGVDATLECDIAFEADVEFYQLNGSSVVATQNDITSVVNQIDFVYDRDCDIQYDVTTILVTTTSVYSTNDAGPLLGQFASRWNSVNAGIQRDVAHLFTGRNLTGSTIGVAYLGTICNLGSAYGLSQSRFSTNFNSRVGLTCHELGHSWSATHCNAASPCYIMCSGLGGCSGNVTLFSPTAIGQITGFAASRTCLDVVPTTPVVTGVSPTSYTTFAPGNATVTGSGFTGATSVQVGGQTLTSGFSVVNDGTMSVLMPQGLTPGFTTLRVTTPLGGSNLFPVQVTLTSPPKLRTTSTIPPAGGLASIDFGGTPGRQWLLLLGITNTTSPFQGFDLMNAPLLLTGGAFGGPLGIENVSIPVPGGLGLLIFYLQVLEFDPAGPSATGTSNIPVVILL